MSVDTSTLGSLLARVYSKQMIQQIQNAVPGFYQNMRPRIQRIAQLNADWSIAIRQHVQFEGVAWIHHCPGGDLRFCKAKRCDLCAVDVPEAVEFMAKCEDLGG